MTTFTLTFTGTVYAGTDNTGIFGALNSLTSDPFTAVYAIDNGSISGAALTITGQTYNFQPVYSSEIKLEPYQVFATVQNGPNVSYDGLDSGLAFNIYSDVSYPTSPPMFPTTLTPFSWTYDPLIGYNGGGYFKIDGYSDAYGDLGVNTITLVESPLAVPGPIIGTGLPALVVACASLIVLAR